MDRLPPIDLSTDGMIAADRLATQMLPDREGIAPYWTDFGRRLLVWGMLYLSTRKTPEDMTVAALKHLLSDMAFILVCLDASMKTAPDSPLHRHASPLQTMTYVPDTFSTIVVAAQSALDAWPSASGARR